MKTDQPVNQKPSAEGISSWSVLFGRIMWFIIGPAILMGTTYGIVTRGSGWVSGLSATYLITVALMVLGRWKEQRSGCATLATGETATCDHFRRYIRLLLPLAGVVWVVANILGNHILNGGE